MGRDATIRRYDPHPHGQPMDLFASAEGRLPVVLELLRSPWILRASDLDEKGEATTCRRLERPVVVGWDGSRRCPASFSLHGRVYPVDALAQTWSIERRWWQPERRVSRRCFRVLARGGVYDLAYDRVTQGWLLVGIVD